MSLLFLPEHSQAMLQSLDLARKEAEHLRYSQSTLFALPIDLAWVQSLASQPVLAEKVEAFVSRFGRLQDHIGGKLLPRYAALVSEPACDMFFNTIESVALDLRRLGVMT